MNRREKSYHIEDSRLFKLQCLSWAAFFDHFHFFNHNHINYPNGAFPDFIAAGCHQRLTLPAGETFEALKKHVQSKKDWLIGYLAYDLKNEVERLSSQNTDRIGAPDSGFYTPEHLLFFEGECVRILSYADPDAIFEAIKGTAPAQAANPSVKKLESGMQKGEYLDKVRHIIEHIVEGDFYEMNFCQDFFGQADHLDPVSTYLALCEKSPMPFSVLQRIENHYVLCASPERFLKKHGRQLISQPIKGTIRRGKSKAEDKALMTILRNDEKERAENMMIVDLVRNDLARSAETGSVRVEELFGIYTFEQVHQMISTVTATLREDVHFVEAIKAAFPMGSMTGAPKIKVMELTEIYENSKRGLYSGAIGFITPEGDFDFNVVIRSIIYNSATKNLSFHVGGAITYDSVPEKEYDECLLKAKAIREVLGEI